MRIYHYSNKINWQMMTVLGLCVVIGGPLINSSRVHAAFNPYGGKTSNLDYRIEGKIISAQGDNYVIRKSTGERVKLRVNENTNMFCENLSSGKPHPSNSTEFDYTGQTSKGFRIGNCPPVPGQYIKAETTDVGTVTFLRTMDPLDVKNKKMQSHTDRFGLSQRYTIEGDNGYAYFPVVPEGLSQKSVEGYEVMTADGNTLGNLRKIIIDTNTGDIMYGIVELDQDAIETKGMEVAGGSLMPLPWSAFQPSEKEGVVKLNVSSQQLANIPGYGEEMNIADIRGYWELHNPQLTTGLPSPHYMGADRMDKMELQRAWQQYKQAEDNFNNLNVVYRDDVASLERARKQYEEAFLRYSREGGKKTIQQKLQSQIFR